MDLEPKSEALGAEAPKVDETVIKPELKISNELEEHATAEDQPTVSAPMQPVDDFTVHEPQKHKHHKYIIAATLIVLAFALGVFGTLLYTKNNQKNDQKDTAEQTAAETNSTSAETKTPATPIKATATWLEAPQKLAIQPVFTDQWFKDSFGGSNPPIKIDDVLSFYKIGSIDGEDLIIATVSDGPGSTTLLFKKSGNSYTLYQQHSNTFYAVNEGGTPEYQGPALTAAVKIDKTSQITDIVPPDSIKVNNQAYSVSKYGALGVDFISTKVPSSQYMQYLQSSTIPEGIVYEAITKDEPAYKVSYFTLMTKDHRMHPYVMNGEVFKIGSVQPITWNDNSKNTVAYGSAVGGCSFSEAAEIAKNITDASLIVSGKSSDGASVYMLKDINHPLLVKHYDEYKEITKYDNSLPADAKNLTIAQFKQKNGIYLAKDNAGRWIVMTNPDYFPSGGCAKPVVYLYPTVTTIANVTVGADVTKSEPFYPVGGWKTVLAQPNGDLRYQGKLYDSLFWEGYGKGAYPEITSGVFVKRSSVEQRIRADLAAQGLNTKEINDFWAFWSAKVPQNNYVRLTWLSKQQLQTLAPLYVTPKPDTVIRVFLDMEGADEPYVIAPQKFITPKRNGFTVTEWGGLARDGSVPKLQ